MSSLVTRDLSRPDPTATLDLALDAWGTPLLFVSTDVHEARALEARLGGTGDEVFSITHVRRWPAALEALDSQEFAAVLLDADSFDSDPARALALLRAAAPLTPGLVLVGLEAPEIDAKYLVDKDDIERRALLRRIKARQARRASSSAGKLAITQSPTRVEKAPPSPRVELELALEALQAGRVPQSLEVGLEPLAMLPNGSPVAGALRVRTRHGAALREAIVELDDPEARVELWSYGLDAACGYLSEGEVAQVVLHLGLDCPDHEAILCAVSDALDARHLPPGALQIALREAEVMAEPDKAQTWAAELRLLGVGLALTGVGAGPTDFVALGRLGISRLEADATLVQQVLGSAAVSRALAGIAAVARAVGAMPSADGVDRDLQAVRLGELGYRAVRGPWASRPR